MEENISDTQIGFRNNLETSERTNINDKDLRKKLNQQ